VDELEAIGDPGLREALLYARAQVRAVTADELAGALHLHRNVARFRLERLVQAGLLEVAYERRTGRSGPGAGRPAKTYAVTPDPDTIEFPARGYEELLGLLVAALPERGRGERLRRVGVAFGRQLARSARLRPAARLTTGFERMCEAVRALGYQASVAEVTGRGAVIATPTCPLRPLVRAHAEATEIDRGMWTALAAKALTGVDVASVDCETRDCLVDHAACRVLITVRARGSTAPKKRS
jgi:predicted ArsR family transcriptional regulator